MLQNSSVTAFTVSEFIINKGKTAKNEWENYASDLCQALYSV